MFRGGVERINGGNSIWMTAFQTTWRKQHNASDATGLYSFVLIL
jgi:hypothetical protein